VSFLVWLAVAGLYGTLARATWAMLDIVADEKSPILQVPGSVTYGCVMGGMAMLALLALVSAWEVWRGPAAHAAAAAAVAAQAVPDVPGVHIA
jgi:TRAP-type C4-dicarboxylate transport system permease small subunit